jgi:thymidylate synthase
MLEFRWAVKADKVRLYDPLGSVAICCLWTPADYLERRLREECPEIFRPGSGLALIGPLYGGGLGLMLRNLHHNPQIDSLIISGQDFSGAAGHLMSFFQGLAQPSGRFQDYIFPDGRKERLEITNIPGSGSVYSMDSLVGLPLFQDRVPSLYDFSKEGPGQAGLGKIQEFFKSYRPRKSPAVRPEAIPLPKPDIASFPAELSGQSLSGRTIPETWSKLLFALSRFGRPALLRNGKERLELLSVKALVHRPDIFDLEEIKACGLDRRAIEVYQEALVSKEPPPAGLSYTYGHRMRSYFGEDMLEVVARDLSQDLDSRHSYVTLWDNRADPLGRDAPCLVSLFFRKIEGKVHLSASFRSHNASRAWPLNCFGLFALNRLVCDMANRMPAKTEKAPLSPGSLSVVSLSISLDPADLSQARPLIDDYAEREISGRKLEMDPNGYFRIAIDAEAGEILAFQSDDSGQLVAEYRAKEPAAMFRQLKGHMAISDIGHALYLGSQLERAWHCLSKGLPYVQDKSKLG